jgi:hypothetical protein
MVSDVPMSVSRGGPTPPSALDARLRGLAHDALSRHAYAGAAFFAEQLAALDGD